MAQRSDSLLVKRGRAGAIYFGVASNGSVPAKEFLESQKSGDRAKLAALFERLADLGEIRNRELFKNLSGRLWEFKKHQLRVTCVRDGRDWFLLTGVRKKQDRWKQGELATAHRIMREVLQDL